MSRLEAWGGPTLYRRVLLVLLLGLTLFLCTHNLETYPRTWWDEGKFLQIPRNLVLYGRYATQSSEGFRMFSVYGTGPAVLLPIAAVFRLFGIGLLQARLVMAGFALLAVVAFYSVARRLYDGWVALVAAALLVTVVYDPFASLLFLGRQVLGEVPAFFYLMAGCYVWMGQRDGPGGRALVLSGVFWGLAVLAKWVFSMIVPCLVVLWVADRLYFRKLGHRHFAIPILVVLAAVLAWFGYVTATLGLQGASEVLLQTQDNATSNVFFVSLASVARGAKFLVRSRFLVWGVPGIAYGVLRNAQGGRKLDVRHWFLPIFAGGWLIWYLFLSLGWTRQAFAPLAISNVFLAKLLYDLSGGFDLSLGKLASIREGNLAPLQRLSVVLMLLALLASSPVHIVEGIVGEQDTSPQEFARYLNERVPTDVVIESYEYQLDILTNHTYHHPPEPLITLATRHVYSGEPYPPGFYDFQAFRPAYLIAGPFAKWTGIYPGDFLEHQCSLVESIGEFDLYRVHN
jgi:4-amino-4-deoxy-L-arabinose transferase-like glycosyltransferase